MCPRLTACCIALLALAACATREPQLARPDVGPRTEHTIYNAIDLVHASDAQRLAILNAYDATNGRLRALATRSGEVMTQWQKLDRTAGGFTAQVDALAAQWAAVNAEEMKTRAVFERQIATTLDPAQWGKWQEFMNSRASQERDYFLGGGGPQDEDRPARR